MKIDAKQDLFIHIRDNYLHWLWHLKPGSLI
jgi:hypothetical protein